MKKKEKLILSAILLAVGTVLNLFFTAALHGLMSGQYDTLTLVPFLRCLTGLLTERQQSLLFLSFEGFLACAQISNIGLLPVCGYGCCICTYDF